MFRHIFAARLKCLFTLILLMAAPAFGQTDRATVSGTVQDTTDARIPGANIKLVNTDTGRESTSKTNSEGSFVISGAMPGHYTLQIERDGFATTELTGITLNVGDDKNVIVQLKTGTSTETMTVDSTGLTINTTDATVSTVIDRQFVENLPLNGRSFQSLLNLSPGVALNQSVGSNPYSQGGFVVNGQRGDANYWMVDGVGANFGVNLSLPGAAFAGAVGAANVVGGTSALVPVDALQEFRIETSTFAPEFGRAPGGQISIQTRSGTNNFHGAIYDYLRNGDLDATDWFADHNGLTKPLEIQNDFGGVLGGPIVKSKTFFFFSYEGFRLRTPQTFLATVPDLAARANSVLAMQPYMNAFPLPKAGAPDTAPGSGLVAYSASFSQPATSDSFGLRIDHQLSRKISLFARYSHAPSSELQRGTNRSPVNSVSKVSTTTKTATAGATWAGSDTLINDLRFNYSVSGGTEITYQDTFGGASAFPLTNLFGDGLTYADSQLSWGTSYGTNLWLTHGFYSKGFQRQINITDNLLLQWRTHSFRFGVDHRRLSPTAAFAHEEIYPYFDTMEDTMAGLSYETDIINNVPQSYVLNNLGTFAQDTWRLSDRLNMTYGLRWDVDFTPTVTQGLGYAVLVENLNLHDLSQLQVAPSGTSPYKTQYANISPRVGVAYQLRRNPGSETVLRGGFGVFRGLASTEIFNVSYARGYYPVAAFAARLNVAFPSTPDTAALPPPEFPTIENGGTLFTLDPNLKVPYALEWNVSLERALGKAQSATLSYVASSGRDQLLSELVANPTPDFAFVNIIGSVGTSNYQSLQAQLQRRLVNGLQAQVSYTWSHSIDTGSVGSFENGFFSDINSNRGSSDADVRHSLTGALTYMLPGVRSNAFTSFLTNGWSLHSMLQLFSGVPASVSDGNRGYSSLSGNGSLITIRPDIVPGTPFYLHGSQYPGGRALNPAAFQDPPLDPETGFPARQGNLPRNYLRGPGLAQWDQALHREFAIHEALKLQFRAELFNVVNHPNFGPYNGTFQTGNIYFGQSTQMLNQLLGGGLAGNGAQSPLYAPGGPRSIQLSLKLLF